jgi:hypothetical protein
VGQYTYKHTGLWEGFLTYAVEMGSRATMYIPSLIKIGAAIQKFIRGYTDSMVIA